MYHIRRSDDHDERSLHMENDMGLRMAIGEACLRTHCTGVEHEIVDDEGRLVHAIKIKPEVVSKPEPRKPVPLLTIVAWAWVAAALLYMAINR